MYKCLNAQMKKTQVQRFKSFWFESFAGFSAWNYCQLLGLLPPCLITSGINMNKVGVCSVFIVFTQTTN